MTSDKLQIGISTVERGLSLVVNELERKAKDTGAHSDCELWHNYRDLLDRASQLNGKERGI